MYRNKISSITRLSKNNHYHAFFAENLNNMKNTWNGTNRKQVISSLKRPDDNSLTNDPARFLTSSMTTFFRSVKT